MNTEMKARKIFIYYFSVLSNFEYKIHVYALTLLQWSGKKWFLIEIGHS